MCSLFGYSRQAYYKHRKDRTRRHHQLSEVRDMVMRIRARMPRLGARKLFFLIQEELRQGQIKLGRDVFFNFLRAEHLLVRPKRSYVKTTNSKHWMKRYPNLVSSLEVVAPEQLWVSDITYIKTQSGHQYLSLITDAYSKRIMGYDLQETLSTEGPLNALSMAIKARKYSTALIHHSDRGLQYCSADYTHLLRKNNIEISMTQNGDPYENPIAERVNGILKYEFLLVDGFKNHQEALKVIKQSIEIYNTERPHLSCGMLVPAVAHGQGKIKIRKWNKKPRLKAGAEN